jgi:prepilin signal peptidase PulO-like enzyme (type II secretory pathway)
MAGAGTFLLVAMISEAVLKKEGMGGGDIKFMLAVGLFLGLKLTLLCLFLSVVLGGIAGAALLIKGRKAGDTEMPFGPFIVAAAFICVFFGNGIIVWYINNFIL